MKKILIKSLKIVFGATLSIIIAEVAGLDYSSAAGILCIISIFETRRQTLRLGNQCIYAEFEKEHHPKAGRNRGVA